MSCDILPAETCADTARIRIARGTVDGTSDCSAGPSKVRAIALISRRPNTESDGTGEKRGQHEEAQRNTDLDRVTGNENQTAAVTVDDLPGHECEAKRRQELHQADQAQRQRTAGERIDVPADRDRLHLVGGIRGDARDEQQPERSMAKQRRALRQTRRFAHRCGVVLVHRMASFRARSTSPDQPQRGIVASGSARRPE